MKKTGEILRFYRKKNEYTLERLAKELNRSISYINSLETERKPFPKTEVGDKIIRILKISEADIKTILEYEIGRSYYELIKNIKTKNLLGQEVPLPFFKTPKFSLLNDDFNQGKYIKLNAFKKIYYLEKELILDEIEDSYIVESALFTLSKIFALKLNDGLIENTILPKDSIALIEKKDKLKDGDIGVLMIENKILIREYKEYSVAKILKSHSQYHEDIEMKNTDSCIIIGKVIEYKVKL